MCFGCFCFFFQAEDGIRDWSVTGVQTCALPIYGSSPNGAPQLRHKTQAMPAETVSPEEVAKAFGKPAEMSDSAVVTPESDDSGSSDVDNTPEPVAAGDGPPRRRRRRRSSSD